MRREKGITLVALIITIIVLVILVGVSIGAMLNSGIIKNTDTAITGYNKEEATEKMNLKITNIQMETYAQQQTMPTLQILANALYHDKEIEYVNTSKTVASTVDIDDIDIGEATSIYTKLKEYPYEFEIDSSLRLASVDGVKVAANKEIENLINQVISEKLSLSFNEKVVGTFVDGKPLYQKTIQANYTSEEMQAIPHNIENVDNIYIDVANTFMKNADNTCYPFVALGVSKGSIVDGYVSLIQCVGRTNIMIRGAANHGGGTAYITLKYTKTTD